MKEAKRMSEHTNKHTETHVCDLIERQAAIWSMDGSPISQY